MTPQTGEEGALCAIQLVLSADDFKTERRYRAAIERAVEVALPGLEGARHRLLVFPENTGHFIPLLHAPRAARYQPTLTRAMALLVATRPLRVARAMWDSRTLDIQRGLMLDAMPAADALMRSVFSAVARQTGAYVVAGSHLRAQADAVTNTSYTFAPDGRLLAATNKVNLVPGLEDHRPGGVGLARGQREQLPVVETPFGRLSTLICYDGFCVPHTRDEPEFTPLGRYVDELGARVIANPSANPWPWRGPWFHAQPGDRRTRDQQWCGEGLAGSMAGLRNVRYGVTAHLCARILDLAFEGPSEILTRVERAAPDGQTSVGVLARASDHKRLDAVIARVPVA